MINFSTTREIISGDKLEKAIVASSRFLNSGENILLIASVSSPVLSVLANPMASLARSAAPAFVVMISITLRKSIFFPL